MLQASWVRLIFFGFIVCSMCTGHSAVIITNGKDGSRLGDQLLYYIKLKWFCRQNNFSFVLSPFVGSDFFLFSYLEKSIHTITNQMIPIMAPDDERSINVNKDGIYAPSFYFKSSGPTPIDDFVVFRNEMRKCIVPITFKKKVSNDAITIAMHVRKGSGADFPLLSIQQYESITPHIICNPQRPLIIDEPGYTESEHIAHMHTCKKYEQYKNFQDVLHPLRFPPDQYYIDQLKYIISLFPEVPICVYIFTDDHNLKKLIEIYKKAVDDARVTFLCGSNNAYNIQAVIDDLFFMTSCTCLIRSGSHLSLVAEFLGDHVIAISPRKYRWDFDNKKLTITDVSMNIDIKKMAVYALSKKLC